MNRIVNTACMLGVIGCLVIASPAVLAEETHWYLGGNIGQSKAKIDRDRINAQLIDGGFTSSTISDNDSDTAYKLFAGYHFNRNFAVEFGYFDLGKFSYTATTVPAGSLSGRIKLQGVNLDLLGFMPIDEKLSAFARIGVNYAEAKDAFSSTGNVNLPSDPTPSKRATHYKAGVGLQYDLNPSLGLRAEAERYRIDDAVGNLGDVNLFSVGLVYYFDRASDGPTRVAERQYTERQPAVVRAAPVPVKVMTEQYCSILDIEFEINQDVIERKEKEKLAVIGTFMKKYPTTTAVIEGHSDSVGRHEDNLALSQRRADSVVNYLVNAFNIDSSRLSAVGYGATRPIADNRSWEGKQKNRRINAIIACVTDVVGIEVDEARVTMALQMDFDPYKSEIKPEHHSALADVARFMRTNPSVTATVEGHASNLVGTGARQVQLSPDEAMRISQQRAAAVVNHLVNREGISRARLSSDAHGARKRVTYGTTLDAQLENRRINVIFSYSN